MKLQDKKDGFGVPDGYFAGLTDKVMQQIAENESLGIPEMKDGFTVPDGYFESFAQRLQQRLEQPEPKVVPLFNKRRFYFAAASVAAVAVVALAVFTNRPQGISFDDLASSDIENYLYNSEPTLTDMDLAEALPIHELEVDDVLEHQLSDANIEEYLDNHIEDIYELNLTEDEDQ